MKLTKDQRELAIEAITGSQGVCAVIEYLLYLGSIKKVTLETRKSVQAFLREVRKSLEELA